jgi:hypothetical protein
MPHLSYSPDLASYDFCLNDYIKSKLSDHTNEESLTQEIDEIVNNTPVKEFKRLSINC